MSLTINTRILDSAEKGAPHYVIWRNVQMFFLFSPVHSIFVLISDVYNLKLLKERIIKKLIAVFTIVVMTLFAMAADDMSLINKEDSPVKVYFEVETGLFGVLIHTYQSGRTDEGATNFDFVNEGDQDILFPFERYVAGLTIKDKHKIGLLYQPLTVVTNVTFRDDVLIDSVLSNAMLPD